MARRAEIVRILFLVLGLLFVGLGVIGAFLPVLPTTPFMIVALACFARSSQRFHDWLFNHPLFGPPLQKWQRHRVIPPVAKAMAITAMGASFVYVVTMTSASGIAMLGMGLFIGYGGWYVLSKPGAPPDSEAREEAS